MFRAATAARHLLVPHPLFVMARRAVHRLVKLLMELLFRAVRWQVELVRAGARPREALLRRRGVREDVHVELGDPAGRQPGARGDEVEEAGPLRLVHLQQLCHQVLVGRRLLAQAAHRVEVVQQRLLVPLDAVLPAEHLAELRTAEGHQALKGEDVVQARLEGLYLLGDAGLEPEPRGLVREVAHVLHVHGEALAARAERGAAQARLHERDLL
mmetsp:Transcript_7100/g.20957  ORF Transcript_7100/g.20957 Transcript_7100/m.20957 type:complete len:213 (+) Transcript_7100:126-764(+)